ncbi:MAG: hypothetical protein WCG21_08975 [Eubacteriales bacterium]
MRKITPSVCLEIIVSLGILAGTLFMPAGCSQKAADQSTSLTEVTSTVPTGPDEVFEVKLGSSELLKDLLEFKWQDVTSVTLIKYQDYTKVSTVTIQDQEKLTSIEDLFNKISVIHASSDKTAVPDENIVYEIFLDTQLSEDDSGIFLLVGPLYDDQTFTIGGSFIKAQSLTPLFPLLQTNQFVTFADVKNIFDPMLEAG